MSPTAPEPEQGASAALEPPALTAPEQRVLGVLVEKGKTTPDTYPLSLNALAVGCNQKSNRDPVISLTEDEVEEALAGAQAKGLVIKITGGRVVRWRHALYEALGVGKVELAVLGELLLRGAQTEGELRGRASRMEPIEDLDALRAVLRPLAQRRLVVYLSPEGRRGTVLTHGLYTPEELGHLRAAHGTEGAEVQAGELPVPARPRVSLEARLAAVEDTVQALQDRITALDRAVEDLTRQVRASG
jgi:uncharacterized protein YceH (UPF0502 family)